MRACTARSKPIKRSNLNDKNVQTFSCRAGGFRIPGPARVFRGHPPGASHRPWTSRRYDPYHVPGEGTEGLAAHPWRSAVKLLIHLFGCWRGSLRPPLLERRAARPTRPGSRSCAAGAPRELSHPSAEPPRPTGAVSSRRACVSSSFGGCNPAPPCARTGWSCCDPLFRGSPHDGSTDGKPCNQRPRTQRSSEEHATRTCRQKPAQNGPTPASPTSRARLPCTSARISHTSASLRLSLRTFFPDKIPDQDGGASPTKSFKTAHVFMGFPLVPVLVHHAPSISARGRWGRPGRRDGYASRASHTCECSWPEWSPPYVVALCMSATAEGWGEDKIKPGIAH
jgi:hypothetical protein